LKVCGPRNARGYGPFGKLVPLDKYDTMVLKGDINHIPLQKWILRSKNKVLKRAEKQVKNMHKQNSIHLL
jgi:hypothetical protein